MFCSWLSVYVQTPRWLVKQPGHGRCLCPLTTKSPIGDGEEAVLWLRWRSTEIQKQNSHHRGNPLRGASTKRTTNNHKIVGRWRYCKFVELEARDGLHFDSQMLEQQCRHSSRYAVNQMPSRIDILPECQTSRPAEQMDIQTDRCTARYADRYATEQATEQLTRLRSLPYHIPSIPYTRDTLR